MKLFVAALCALMLWGGAAAAADGPSGLNAAPGFLIFPSWHEVMDIIGQGREKDKDNVAAPAPAKGAFHPYIGVADLSPDAYLIPGNRLDVSGGLSYYSPGTGRVGSVGMIFAVKDRVSNRLTGYTFEPGNVTTYISFSINY